MKVYVVLRASYEGSGGIVRMFKTQQQAVSALELLKTYGDTFYSYSLEEHEVLE